MSKYWCEALKTAGIRKDQAAQITSSGNQWVYLGKKTKIGKGSHKEACDRAVLKCAGTRKSKATYGTGKRQVALLKAYISTVGDPETPQTNDRQVALTMEGTLIPTTTLILTHPHPQS